jgi:hypothetical protein
MGLGCWSKTGLALSLAIGISGTAVEPTFAGNDAGAFLGGAILCGALGAIAGSAAARNPGPPPDYYAPAYAPPPPPRCWFEPREVWDPYADGYVVRRVRVCE